MSGNSNLSTPTLTPSPMTGVVRSLRLSVCSYRAEFLTGRHHVRGRVCSTSAGGERMDLDEMTIADLFKKAATPRSIR